MQFSGNNLLMTDHVFLGDNATQNVWFLICHFKLPSSPYGVWCVMAAGMLFVGLSYCISLRPSMLLWGVGFRGCPGAALVGVCGGGVRPWHCRVRRQWGCFLVPGAYLCILDAGSRTDFLHIDEM